MRDGAVARRRHGRRRAVVGVAVVLLVHGLALRQLATLSRPAPGVRNGPASPGASRPARAIRRAAEPVRPTSARTSVSDDIGGDGASPAPATSTSPLAAGRRTLPPDVRPAVASPGPSRAPAGPTATSTPTPAGAPDASPATPPASPSAAADARPAALPDPPRPTRPPPSTTVAYRLLDAGRPGTATLDWRHAPGDAGWRLTLATQVAGRPDRGWTSHGGLDAHGLAPERLEQSDRGRPTRAVNFQRDRAVVSWSGRPDERPLPAGIQDHWSWVAQLAAAAEAAPARWPAGTVLHVPMAGLRGELDTWTFEVVPDDDARDGAAGRDRADAPGPAADVAPTSSAPSTSTPRPLHVRRGAARPYDLQVDAWLEPSLHHLPSRLVLAAPPGRWWFVLQRDPTGADQDGPAAGPEPAP